LGLCEVGSHSVGARSFLDGVDSGSTLGADLANDVSDTTTSHFVLSSC